MSTETPSNRETANAPLRRTIVEPLREFLSTEASAAIVLLIAAVVAIVWVNAPFGDSYEDLWTTKLTLGIGKADVSLSLRHWINDGLMTLFFFVVGLEVKRELVVGELNEPRKAAAPVLAAVGGMVVPAGIYFALNAGTDGAPGWGIPMATDIAFAVGVLALLGRRAPSGLRTFLLSLAIVDDIGAILVIALFYSDALELIWLASAGGLLLMMVFMRTARIRYMPLYVLVGIAAWFATVESGIHATIAGVAIALLTPARTTAERLEHHLHPWASFAVLPVFALANAGVVLSLDDVADSFTSRVTLGIVLGLVVGKIVGITGATLLAQRTGLGVLPVGVSLRQLVAVAAVAGIGFTVSLFVTSLAFTSSALVAEAKIGVLAASIGAAFVAYVVLRTGPAPAAVTARDD
jgi:Na+:H+ antiporter, NhaA family